MLNTRNHIGYWKVPGDPNELPGELNFTTEKGIELKLLGSFGKEEEYESEYEFPIIHGFTADGKKFSLINCWGYTSTAMPGIKQSTFSADYIIIGSFINNIEDLKIDTVVAHFTMLDEWVNINGFETRKTPLKKDEPFTTFIKYKQPELIKLYESEEKLACLWFSVRAPWIGLNNKSNSIDQKVYLNLKYSNATKFSLAMIDVDQFRNLFAFGLSRIIAPTEIILHTQTPENETQRLTLIYKEKIYPRKVEDHIFEYTTLFSYEHIKEKTQEVIGNWIMKYEQLHPVFDRFFDSFYNPNTSSSNHFLNLMFGIETYHRRTTSDTYFSKEHFEELKKTLQSALPDVIEDKEWFNMRFNYANEIPLKKRLHGICNEFEEIISLFEPDINAFIKKVSDTRNYLVHYDERLRKKAISEADIPGSFMSIRIILQLCLLKELGFSKEEMKKAVKRSQINWSKFHE